MSTLRPSMGAAETPADVKLFPSGRPQIRRVVQVEALFEKTTRALVVGRLERLEDGAPRARVDDGAIDEGVVEAGELDEDLVHPWHVVEGGKRRAKEIDRVVFPLVALVPKAPPVRARLRRVVGGISHV